MISEILSQALAMAQGLKHLYIITTSGDGMPHLATAGGIDAAGGDDQVRITAWFCTQTIVNVHANPQISIVIWDEEHDTGYQLLGTVEGVEEVAIMNGYTPEEVKPMAQFERQLFVIVNKILSFSHARDSDSELF